jgi:hypothetical protein
MPEVKMQKKPRRWKGKLAKKIQPQINRPQGLGIPIDPTEAAKRVAEENKQMEELFRQAVEKEYDEKLDLLFQHYKITRGDLRALAIKLATELDIPGFQVVNTLFRVKVEFNSKQCTSFSGPVLDPDRKEGRPAIWTLERLEELRTDVEKIQKETRRTDQDALKCLVARYPQKWGPPLSHPGSWQKTLQNRLGEAKKMHRFIEDAANKGRKELKELILEEYRKKIPET